MQLALMRCVICMLGVAALITANVTRAEQYIGLVHPAHEITLSMGVSGVVSQVHVRHGQKVSSNQPLLVLDDRLQTLEVKRRKVVLEDMSELRAVEERVRALTRMRADTRAVYEKTGSISRDEMDRLEVEYASAHGRLEQLQAQKRRERLEYEAALQELAQRRLVAPLAGVITKIDPDAGEWVKPGEPLAMLVDASTCFLTVHVPLKLVDALKTGMKLPVGFEPSVQKEATRGVVSFISPVADPASGLVEIRITFANPELRVRPGTKGWVDIPAPAASH